MSDTKIEDLDLSVRICKALKNEGINTLQDLVCKTEDDLLKVHSLGRKSIKVIKRCLYHLGWNLRSEFETCAPAVLPQGDNPVLMSTSEEVRALCKALGVDYKNAISLHIVIEPNEIVVAKVKVLARKNTLDTLVSACSNNRVAVEVSE